MIAERITSPATAAMQRTSMTTDGTYDQVPSSA